MSPRIWSLLLLGTLLFVEQGQASLSRRSAEIILKEAIGPVHVFSSEKLKRHWRVKAVHERQLVKGYFDRKTHRLLIAVSDRNEVYRWTGPKIVSHRGDTRRAPEGTLAAFRSAAAQGADAVELDVRQTKDGHFVILHDSTVNRTTDGYGFVSNKTLKEVQALDAGSWFAPEFAGERIPTLEETLDLLPSLGLTADIDYKTGDPQKLFSILKSYTDKTGVRPTFNSSDWSVLDQAKLEAPFILIRPSTFGLWPLFLSKVKKRFAPELINISEQQAGSLYARKLHGQSYMTFVNAIFLPSVAQKRRLKRAFGFLPDYLQTDDIEKALEARAEVLKKRFKGLESL